MFLKSFISTSIRESVYRVQSNILIMNERLCQNLGESLEKFSLCSIETLV